MNDLTTLYQQSVTYTLRNHTQIVNGIASTNSFGSPDLDTQPPEIKRSTIFTWVQRCVSCGYFAENLENQNPKAASIVKSHTYEVQLNNPAYPQLTNSFRCKAMIDQSVSVFTAGIWSLIHAAWVCDNEIQENQAIQCRQDVVEMLLRTKRKK